MEIIKDTFYFLQIFSIFQKTKYKQVNRRIFFFYMKLFSRMVLFSKNLYYIMIYNKVFRAIKQKQRIGLLNRNRIHILIKLEYIYVRFLLKIFYKYILLNLNYSDNIEKKKKKLHKFKKK